MRILLISNLYPPETIGGAEKYVRNIARRLVSRGHDIAVITTGTDAPQRNTRDGVDIYRLSPTSLYTPYEHRDVAKWKKPIQHVIDLWNPAIYRSLTDLLPDFNFDLIHTHNFGGLSTAVFTATGQADAPVVHTLHDYRLLDIRPDLWADGELTGIRGWLAPFRLFNRLVVEQNISQVVAPSQFIIDLHQDFGLFNKTPCTRIPLGVEPPEEEHIDRTKDSQNTRLLFAGQLTEQKGIFQLIQAVAKMPERSLQLDILGKGPELEMVREQTAADSRINVHGFVSEDRLSKFYRRADATVVPSLWYDNSPMVIYESFAHGTPVLGARNGGIPELIKQGETGFLFDPRDLESIKSAIHQLLSTDASVLEESVCSVRNQYTLEKHIDSLVRVYNELLRRER